MSGKAKCVHGCEVCGACSAQRHEIVSRGSGGPREDWNTIWLCPDHHTLGPDAYHRIGRTTFAARFPQFAERIVLACARMGRVLR